MTVSLVEPLRLPPREPDEFLERLRAGKVRSWVIVYVDTPDADNSAIRYSTEVFNIDSPRLACALWLLAEQERNKVAGETLDH